MSNEQRNNLFRRYGYYWSKPLRTGRWILLDRRGNDAGSEYRLYEDILKNQDVYEQEAVKAREQAIHAAQTLIQRGGLIFDCETDGMGGTREKIIEVAIGDTQGGILFQSLVNSQGTIHPEALDKSGITQDMLKGAPTFKDIRSDITSILKDHLVCAYNADFDHIILSNEYNSMGLNQPVIRWMDLMRVYMAIVREGRYRLQDACEHFGISYPATHRCADDIEVTRQLLLSMANEQ